MATAEQRFKAATDYVQHAIEAVTPSLANPFRVIDRQVALNATAPVRTELMRVQARWLRASTHAERGAVARDAELLADRTKENLPGAPQAEWKRTNLFAGEHETSTPALSYSAEVQHEAVGDWNWIKQEARGVADKTTGVAQWLLLGGGVLLGLKTLDYLRDRGEPIRNRRGVADTRRALNASLERAAERNASAEPLLARTRKPKQPSSRKR